MTDAEKAIVAALSSEAKAAVKALMRDVADKELPALIAEEENRLPVYAQPIAAGVVGALYPKLQVLMDAKIDSL